MYKLYHHDCQQCYKSFRFHYDELSFAASHTYMGTIVVFTYDIHQQLYAYVLDWEPK